MCSPRFIARGCHPSHLKPVFALALERAPLIGSRLRSGTSTQDPTTTTSCPLHVPFHPLNPTSSDVQSTFKSVMLHHNEIGPLSQICNANGSALGINQLLIVNHQARNLKDCLFPQKFNKRPGNPASSYL